MPWPGYLGGGAGCQVALIITLIPIIRGCTHDPPHKQLLMDVWQVLVCCALGKVMGGHQHEAAGKRGVRTCPIRASEHRPLPSLSVPAPPLSFPPLFITQGMGCLFWG